MFYKIFDILNQKKKEVKWKKHQQQVSQVFDIENEKKRVVVVVR